MFEGSASYTSPLVEKPRTLLAGWVRIKSPSGHLIVLYTSYILFSWASVSLSVTGHHACKGL